MGGNGTLILRGKVWHMSYWDGGKQYRESCRTGDKAAAQKKLAKKILEVTAGDHIGSAAKVTMGDLFDLVIADYREQQRKSTAELLGRITKHLRPQFGKVKAANWSTQLRAAYVANRRREKAENATINRELAVIRRGFVLGYRHEPALVSRVPHIAQLPETNIRQGFFEHAEYEKLLAELPNHCKLLLVIGYHVGIRRGELLNLRWEQVDFIAGQIRLRAGETKNQDGRVCPIYGDMLSWLQLAYTARNPKCPWLCQLEGKRLKSFKTAWAKACARAGVDRRFHDLRRSAVRNMERAGIPRSVARAISGHKSESVYLRYDIVSEADIKQAGKTLEQFFEKPSQTAEKPSQSAKGENTVCH